MFNTLLIFTISALVRSCAGGARLGCAMFSESGKEVSMPFDFYRPDNGPQEQQARPYRPRRPVTIKKKHVVLIILLIFAALTVFTCAFKVDQKEQAVVLRFGEYNRTVGPGLHFKLPYGLEKSLIVPTQTVQTMSFGYRTNTPGNTRGQSSSYSYKGYANESTMLTGDLNIVEAQWIVQYRIEDPRMWLFNVYNNEQTISDISRSVINQLVGDLPILSVMTSQRSVIETEAQVKLQQVLSSYDMGVRILTVKLQDVVPPAGNVQDAFEDVNKAIQDMNKLINEGKESYNSIIPAAQGEANRLIKEAEGYAAERVNSAKGDVARFESVRNEYEKSKEITGRRLYLETMEQVLENGSGKLTVVDSSVKGLLPVFGTAGTSPATGGK